MNKVSDTESIRNVLFEFSQYLISPSRLLFVQMSNDVHTIKILYRSPGVKQGTVSSSRLFNKYVHTV